MTIRSRKGELIYCKYLLPFMGLFRDDKKITQMNITRLKNPNWWEENQLAILQAWPRIWTNDQREQIQLAVRAGPELGTPDYESAGALTARPRCL